MKSEYTSMEERLAQLEQTVQEIQMRNLRAEQDKTWETSLTRIVSIFIWAYIIIVLFMSVAATPKPFISAIVPSVGFWFSVLTVLWIKQRWLSKR